MNDLKDIKSLEEQSNEETQKEIDLWINRSVLSGRFRAYLKILQGKVDLLFINEQYNLNMDEDEYKVLHSVLKDFPEFADCLRGALETINNLNETIQLLKEQKK